MTTGAGSRSVLVVAAAGLTEHATLPDALAAARDTGGFAWLDLAEPSEADLAELGRHLGLPPLAVEDAVTAAQRPKLEIYGNQVFTVLRPARYLDSDELVEIAEIAIFLRPDAVVTVRHGATDVPDRVRAELVEPDPELLDFGPAAVLYRVADLVVDDYEDVVTSLDADLAEIEGEVFGPDEEDHSHRIYRLKDEVAQLRRAVDPLVRPMEQLAGADVPPVAAHTAHHFRDVYDHVLRASESIDLIDRQLSDALEANSASVTMVQNRIALRQNADMRKISAWGAIGLVPTAIAGVYGMNFQHMPGLSSWWGFPVTLAATTLVCLLLHRAFRRNGWL